MDDFHLHPSVRLKTSRAMHCSRADCDFRAPMKSTNAASTILSALHPISIQMVVWAGHLTDCIRRIGGRY